VIQNSHFIYYSLSRLSTRINAAIIFADIVTDKITACYIELTRWYVLISQFCSVFVINAYSSDHAVAGVLSKRLNVSTTFFHILIAPSWMDCVPKFRMDHPQRGR